MQIIFLLNCQQLGQLSKILTDK